MERFTYENQGINTYLVYAVGADDILDSMALGMITNNNINGIAQTTSVQMNAEKFIKYNVSAKITVKQFFMGAITRSRLLGVFRGIVNALLSSEDYMIDPAMILLDLEYIFVDVSNCDTELICLPVQCTEATPADYLAFFKNIMFSSQFDQTENCDYVAVIMNHLNSTPSFSLADFKSVLDSLNSDNGSHSAKVTKAPAVNNSQVNSASVAVKSTTQSSGVVQPAVNMSTQTSINTQIQTAGAQHQSQVSNVAPAKFANTDVIQTQSPVKTDSDKPEADKPMSKMYLLQHYSKENKAIYDAQQAAKKKKADSVPENNTTADAFNEKPMSKMYLLQHYSKENKAIYDAQQAAKKAKSNASKPADSKKKTTQTSSFAIPGQAGSGVDSVVVEKTSNRKPANDVADSVNASRQSHPVSQPTTQSATTYVQTNVVQQQTFTKPNNATNVTVPVGSVNFGETTVLSGGNIGETTVLNEINIVEQTITPYLMRIKNNERIDVNKPVFRIGKERSYVDYFIADNTAISRSHANIVIREDRCFVVDTNSTNHTFVDGQMIPSNSEIEIVHGTKIRLANEDFEFNLY